MLYERRTIMIKNPYTLPSKFKVRTAQQLETFLNVKQKPLILVLRHVTSHYDVTLLVFVLFVSLYVNIVRPMCSVNVLIWLIPHLRNFIYIVWWSTLWSNPRRSLRYFLIGLAVKRPNTQTLLGFRQYVNYCYLLPVGIIIMKNSDRANFINRNEII